MEPELVVTKSYKEIARRDVQHIKLKPLSGAAKKSIFDAFNKTDFEGEIKLERSAMSRLLKDKATDNPEFLVVVINALVFGKRMGQDDGILSIECNKFLDNESIERLYDCICKDTENDLELTGEAGECGGGGGGLSRFCCVTHTESLPVSLFYRKALCLLYCSNVGLTSVELEEALLRRPEFSTLSRDALEAIWLVIKDFAIQVDGVYVLLNSAIRRTIHRLYIEDEQTKKSYHELLAFYFEQKESSLRTTEEHPHHLIALKDFAKLRECVCDVDMLQGRFLS